MPRVLLGTLLNYKLQRTWILNNCKRGRSFNFIAQVNQNCVFSNRHSKLARKLIHWWSCPSQVEGWMKSGSSVLYLQTNKSYLSRFDFFWLFLCRSKVRNLSFMFTETNVSFSYQFLAHEAVSLFIFVRKTDNLYGRLLWYAHGGRERAGDS